MESVETELPVLINLLLQAPADAQRRLIEKYFLPECRLTHALVRRMTVIHVFVVLKEAVFVQTIEDDDASFLPPSPLPLRSLLRTETR